MIKQRVKEASSRYDDKIEAIEDSLGYDTAIREWEKGISTQDAEEHLPEVAKDFDIELGPISDRRDVFDAIETLEMSIGAESLFKELFQYLSDKVAKYLITGIYNDYDLGYDDDMYESSKRSKKQIEKTLTKDTLIEGKSISKGTKVVIEEATNTKETDPKIEEAFNSNADIENLVYEVQDLTDRNNHIEARLLVAEEFGMTKYYDLFTKIKDIQDLEGYIPNDVATYRYQLTNSMLEIIEKLSGKETRDAVYTAM
ncbi:MAG: hypothetical protein PF569_08245 [Candidatus Woesearchaeota archaeon]|jgi:hypothetical protein|nr:hypothetical protein [Candidatus Woesearchaeota archaeon]